MTSYRSILMAVPREEEWHRGIRRGVYAFARPRYNWGFDTCTDQEKLYEKSYRSRYDGAIGIFSKDVIRVLRRVKLPTVNLNQRFNGWHGLNQPHRLQ